MKLDAAVMKLIQQYANEPLVGDDELTVSRAAELWGIPYPTADNRLRRMVKDGKMKRTLKRQVVDGVSRRCYVYEAVGD